MSCWRRINLRNLPKRFHRPGRSANLSSTRLSSDTFNSPSFLSRRGTGAECICCKWYASSLRNGFDICSSQQFSRSEFVWNTTVTRVNSSSAGGPVRTRHGRTLAAKPASMIQTSPGRGLGFRILCFPAINLLAGCNEQIVRQFHLLILRLQIQNPARNRPPFGFAEFWQLCKYLRCAHAFTVAGGIG